MSRRSPSGESPVVSVVIVTYGGSEWIPRAVSALATNTSLPYELIIVDNASPVETRQLLSGIEGAKVIYNQNNVGFGPAYNQGVLHATAPFICLLNSDAFVEPGWLEPLIDVLQGDPGAGAVVPCLLHPDGTLQEAGGVVGSDGSTRAVGDGASADELQYRFRRYVDYGSAACLLMRRDIFARIGGFDPAYPMGYCEDVDLCFALRDLGLQTVYEPRSKVRHVRWGSSSRHEAEQRVFANQPILLARWRERLAGRPSFGDPPISQHDILQARDAEALDRILLVGEGTADGRGPLSPRVVTLASSVARCWPDTRVTLLVPASARDGRTVTDMLQHGVEVACATDWEAWFESRRFHYSAVLLSGPSAFEQFDPLVAATQPQAARIYDIGQLAHRNAEYLRTWWSDTGPGAQATADRLRSLETWGVESADVVLCASREGLHFAHAVNPVVPAHLVRDLGAAPADDGQRVGFAARRGYLAVGQLPPEEVAGGPAHLGALRDIAARLAGLDKAFTGELAVPGAAAPRVHLLAPPFVSGSPAGIVALGIPFVTWRGGAEGLDLGDLEPILVADNTDAFAQLAWNLHRDQDLWDEVRARLARCMTKPSNAGLHALWGALAHCGLGSPAPDELHGLMRLPA